MSRFLLLSGMFLLMLLVSIGCSDDPAMPPTGEDASVRVDLDPDGADFTIQLESVSTPDSLMRGPFFLRGYNLHYNDVIGALVVDLTITNHSPATFLNPVFINFIRMLPEGTIILNSPDDGPIFEFDFANDDLWWTPGEESLPLTVMFMADLGVSVGFNAFISVGGLHLEGVISGRVWHDMNRNGVIDPDEPGLPEILVDLDNGSDQEILHRTLTDPLGHYQFGNLEPGTYEIRVFNPPPDFTSTTSSSMHVLLAADMGGTSSFTEADFGFVRMDFPLPGPRLVVHGVHMEPHVFYRGDSVMDLRVPPGAPLHFHWEGDAGQGLEIMGYRWGWDVIDPNDPNDAGWAQPEPGLGPEYQEAFWEEPLDPGQEHSLVIHCRDTAEHLTRARILFRVDVPDSVGAE